jgi:hypothetical protein
MRRFILAAVLGIAGLGFAGSKAQAHEPGVGAHDLAPHWHRTWSAFGPVYWYGNGVHDVLPHSHSYSPWRGINSYSQTPFGPTRSFNGYPYSGGYYQGYYGGYRGGHHHHYRR